MWALSSVKKRKSFLLCLHFSFQGVTPWNSRCTGLKNRNQQTYHANGCSRAKAMNYWDKHAQTASAKRRKQWYASIHFSSALSAFHKYQDLFTPPVNSSEKLWVGFYRGNVVPYPTGQVPQRRERTEWHSGGLFMHVPSSASLRSAATHECERAQSCVNMSLCLIVFQCRVVSI